MTAAKHNKIIAAIYLTGMLIAIAPLLLMPSASSAETAAPVELTVYCESGEETPTTEPYGVWENVCKSLDGRAVKVVVID